MPRKKQAVGAILNVPGPVRRQADALNQTLTTEVAKETKTLPLPRMLSEKEKWVLRTRLYGLVKPARQPIVFTDEIKQELNLLFDFDKKLGSLTAIKDQGKRRELSPIEALWVYAVYRTHKIGTTPDDLVEDIQSKKNCRFFQGVAIKVALGDARGEVLTPSASTSYRPDHARTYARAVETETPSFMI